MEITWTYPKIWRLRNYRLMTCKNAETVHAFNQMKVIRAGCGAGFSRRGASAPPATGSRHRRAAWLRLRYGTVLVPDGST
jgi:hypothetical protein